MSSINSSKTGLYSGLVFVLLASLGYSTKAVIIKLGYSYGLQVTPIIYMTLRMALSLPFFIAMLIIEERNNRHPPLTHNDWLHLIGLGAVAYYLTVYLDFVGLSYISASLERLILLLYPTIVVLLSALLYRRPISRKEGLALLISYLGIIVVFYEEFTLAGENLLLGTALIFGSAVAFATYLTGSGVMVQRLGAIRFTAYVLTIACIATLIHFAFVFDAQIFELPLEVYELALLMAILATVAPTFLMSIGIHRIGAGPAAIVSSIGPVMTIVLAWWVLGETLTLAQMVGGVLVMAGAYVVGRKQ
jgi:drug/metabolite transporter (DMT)-like permease